ncbi:MAG: hypothetical protein R3E82_18390 [Pseudomonadales bacterium]|nr:hypothetical protein [Pseudomonadales bacterium]
MKQQVNLLSDDLLPRREPLGLGHLLAAWAFLGVVLALFSGWQGIGIWRMASQLTETRAQWELIDASNEQLKQENESRTDSGLRHEVEALRTARAEQQQLVLLLKDYQSDQANGFSGYLNDLADHQVKGMWLSQIRFDQGGRRIQLKGLTTDPRHVPQFLVALSEGHSFNGHRFDGFALQEIETGLLEFVINGPEGDG